jgi:hypothetical protein
MTHSRSLAMLAVCGALAAVISTQGAELAEVRAALQRPILDEGRSQSDVQAYCEARVPPMPQPRTAAEWDKLARELRAATLDRVVFRGEAAAWRKRKTRVEWLETIEGGPGYRIRKLRYEAVPGLWIPALLYEPERLSGRVPVGLNVNGHEGIGKSVGYKQIRCINQARRGMLVLNPEWIGMGQLNGPGYHHGRMNQLDLCGTSGLAPFYLAMSRGLDILLAHPHADPARVAVAGLSGGGWQTITISALDPRVTLCNPVAGYSSFLTRARHFEDLGDSEQTPTDLATVVDYTHLTAMLAPRPALLTFNAKDNCCFASAHALPPLLEAAEPIYKLYGKTDRLRSHINYEPGDHNFGLDNRLAFYRMLGDFFHPGEAGFETNEIPCEAEVKVHTNLLVALPTNNATFSSLALALSRSLPRQPAKLPGGKSAAEKWQRTERSRLRGIVRFHEWQAIAPTNFLAEGAATNARFWALRVGDSWQVPVTEFEPERPGDPVIVISDTGRSNSAAEVTALLNEGHRVLGVDLFYFGESRMRSHESLFALLLATVGERPLGVQAGQLAAVARWARGRPGLGALRILALGPRSSVIALVAAALEPQTIAGLELRGSLGSLKEILEQDMSVGQKPELFCFGLLEAFDVKHLAALAAPRPVEFTESSERVRSEMPGLAEWYGVFGAVGPQIR